LFVAVGGAVLVLLMPLWLARRYPGQGGMLWKASAIAAGTFAITVARLGASLLLVRNVLGRGGLDQSQDARCGSDAAFAVLAKSETAAAFSDLSKERLDCIKSGRHSRRHTAEIMRGSPGTPRIDREAGRRGRATP
jgi:hypothetical protein